MEFARTAEMTRQQSRAAPRSLSHDDIASRVWTFGFANGEVYTRNVVLAANGRFLHHGGPNEHSWTLEDDRVVVRAQSGRVSAVLAPVPSQDGHLWLEGEHVLGGPSGIHLALREVDLIYPVHLVWSKAMEDFAASVPFYLSPGSQIRGVYAEGQIVTVPAPALVEPYATQPRNHLLGVGAYSYSWGQFSTSPVSIGRYCSIAAGSRVLGPSHPMERVSTSPFSYDPHYTEIARNFGVDDYEIVPYDQTPPLTTIGHDVWIGEDVLIKGGITIGTGAVLAARAIVTRDVPPYAIVAGMPARVQRIRFPSSVVEALLESRWWQYNFCDLPRSHADPVAFLGELARRREEGAIHPYEPQAVDVALGLLRASSPL